MLDPQILQAPLKGSVVESRVCTQLLPQPHPQPEPEEHPQPFWEELFPQPQPELLHPQLPEEH